MGDGCDRTARRRRPGQREPSQSDNRTRPSGHDDRKPWTYSSGNGDDEEQSLTTKPEFLGKASEISGEVLVVGSGRRAGQKWLGQEGFGVARNTLIGVSLTRFHCVPMEVLPWEMFRLFKGAKYVEIRPGCLQAARECP